MAEPSRPTTTRLGVPHALEAVGECVPDPVTPPSNCRSVSNTVRRAVASDDPPKYRRAPKGSIVDAVEPAIRELLAEYPRMPATAIAERIGWERSLSVLKLRVRELRPVYLPADPVSRTAYQPGELAQCDLWFPPANIPLASGRPGARRCW